MNIDSLMRRAERIIKKHEALEKTSKVMTTETGVFPDNFNGLVIIYDLGELKHS